MRAGRPSRTAEYMALFRALESTRPAGQRAFSDPLAAGFLTPPLRAAVALAGLPLLGELVPRVVDCRWPGPRASAIVRTRIIDDALGQALHDGARQVVVLGAGYDTRAYRTDGIDATRVFEVDHPSTQASKRARLEHLIGPVPPYVSFVGIDFDKDKLGAALLRAGYAQTEATFFIWEGVTNYLTAEAVDTTLRWVAEHSGPGSAICFTYIHRGLLDGSASFPGSEPWVAAVRGAGEPFTFGWDPAELADYLAERGLRLISDVSTLPGGFYRVALARTAA